jgi:hypothetical protein
MREPSGRGQAARTRRAGKPKSLTVLTEGGPGSSEEPGGRLSADRVLADRGIPRAGEAWRGRRKAEA